MILDPTDQRIRDQGFNFVPFDRYLASPFQPKTLDMSGGISTLPIVPPILNPNIGGGGEGGGGPNTGPAPDTSGFDYEFDALGGLPNKDNVALTDEEQEAIDNMNNPAATKGMLGTAFGTALGFLNPITAFASLAYQSKKQKEALEEKAREAAAKADFDRAMKQGRGFYDQFGKGDAKSTATREEAGTGFGDVSESGPFASGGRVEGLPVYSPSDRPAMMGGGLIDLVDIYD